MQGVEEALLRDTHHVTHRDRDPGVLIFILAGLFAGAFCVALLGSWGWSGVILAALIALPLWIGAALYRRAVEAEPGCIRSRQSAEARREREARIAGEIDRARRRGAFRKWESVGRAG